MRVLHVIPSLDPADGGPPAVVQRLGAAQAAAGADVGILYYQRPGADQRVRDSIAATPGGDRLALHAIPAPSTAERLTARAATAAARPLLRGGVDFVHIHGIWTPILAHIARLAARSGLPYCITPHGMLTPWSLSQKPTKKLVALALLWRRIINRASFLQALNRDEAGSMAPLAITAPTVVIPNGIFLDEFADLPAPGTFRADHPELGRDPYVLFLSRLHHGKGLDLLAPAFATLLQTVPDARLVVVGPDYGARAAFERQIDELGVAARVHLTGPIYGAAKLAALRDAACFCLPSRHEGFSIAITEALAVGVPCVVAADCHFPEVAEGAGRVTTLNSEAIGAALAEILANPSLADQMGKAGAALVRERFTWPRVAEQVLEAYRSARLGVHKTAGSLATEPQH